MTTARCFQHMHAIMTSHVCTKAQVTAGKLTAMEPSKDSPTTKEPLEARISSASSETNIGCERMRPEHKSMNAIYRKLDLRIIPALWCLYFLTSFGGGAYGNSLTMNASVGHSLPLNLGTTSHQLQTANALYYVGYIVFDLPMNLIMSRVRPNTWLARIVISVGATYMCYAAVVNGKGIMAIRIFTGLATAGVWPGMAYYITMWYPNERTAQRVGLYFVAAQISTAVAGLVAAGFQKMDGTHGYTGYQWLFIVYGAITTFVGFTLIWWLPGRPSALQRQQTESKFMRPFNKYVTSRKPLNSADTSLHEQDMAERYAKPVTWSMKDLGNVLLDFRLWPFVIMYFGVVGVGNGLVVFATTIIKANNPSLSDINLSLLTAPIWLFDAAAIILITPLSDRFRNYRGIVFSLSTVIIMVGLFVATYANTSWSRWGGLLICGFGLGPTVPITMTWAAHIFSERHGDLGAAAATALVSGFGNLGSVTTVYALYRGWPEDAKREYRDSNMVMVSILGASIIAAACCTLVRYAAGDFKGKSIKEVTFLNLFLK